MKRLVCVVEGHGEVEAIPDLCARILAHLDVRGWFVDPDPVRQPRSRLVDEAAPSPLRPANQDGLRRAVALAKARPADGVLVLCDSDDDCAAHWGQSAEEHFGDPRVGAVMAIREFETWLLSRFSRAELSKVRVTGAIVQKRDAKGALAKLIPGYKPSTHQLPVTRGLDIERARTQQPSFDKMVRTVERICGR